MSPCRSTGLGCGRMRVGLLILVALFALAHGASLAAVIADGAQLASMTLQAATPHEASVSFEVARATAAPDSPGLARVVSVPNIAVVSIGVAWILLVRRRVSHLRSRPRP